MESKFLCCLHIANTVTAFTFAKPTGFTYQPGQFIRLELTIPDCDTRCNQRNFSLTSTPDENTLSIATRNGVSRFKQTLAQLKTGETINLTGPFGKFLLNESIQPAVILSGGIGITPILSMLKSTTAKKLNKPITLIFSNSTSTDILFKPQLDELAKLDKSLTLHYIVTRDPAWTGEKERINADMLKRLVPNFMDVEFYLCGPAAMVLELKKILADLQVQQGKIKTELFSGYS